MTLTPDEHARIDKAAARWARAAGLTALAALALFAVAIWVGDWRYAGIGGLVALAAFVCLIVNAAMNSPETRRRVAERRPANLAAPTRAEIHQEG